MNSDNHELAQRFAFVDAQIHELERGLAGPDSVALSAAVDQSIALVKRLLRVDLASRAAPVSHVSPRSEGVLDVLQAFVKGDPSRNAVRDNFRELVYHRNCLDAGRDALLPARAATMTVWTLRHVFLYLRSRAGHDGRLAGV